jgi:gas vesicle protein
LFSDSIKRSTEVAELMGSAVEKLGTGAEVMATEKAISEKARESKEKLQKLKSDMQKDIQSLEKERKRIQELKASVSINCKTVDDMTELQRLFSEPAASLVNCDTTHQVERDTKQRGPAMTWDDVFHALKKTCEGTGGAGTV